MNINIESVSNSDQFKAAAIEPITGVPTPGNDLSQGHLGNILDRLEQGLGNSMGNVQDELLKVMDNQGAVNSSMLILQLKVSEHAYSMSIASGVASSARQSMQSLLQNG